MAIGTAAGTKFYIGPAIVPGAEPANVAAYKALTYVEIGEVEDGGTFGDSASDVTFASLGDSRMRHLKGVFDAGAFDLVVGADAQDAGQTALGVALYDRRDFAVKVEYDDELTTGGTGTIEFFSAKVMGGARQVGSVDNVIRRTYSLGINTPILVDPAT